MGVLSAFLALLLASHALSQETVVSALVVGISDGDTVKALVAGNQLLRTRLTSRLSDD
jgi:endonuclease YncB( thermonuclease family)